MIGCRGLPRPAATIQAFLWAGTLAALSMLAAQACRADDVAPPKTQSHDAIRFCDGYGPSFFATPLDSCIRVGGLVMAEVRGVDIRFRPIDIGRAVYPVAGSGVAAAKRQAVSTGADAFGRIEIDIRQQTDYGPVRAFLRLDGVAPLTRRP